jgi:superfamily II DNA helicase RecQ
MSCGKAKRSYRLENLAQTYPGCRRFHAGLDSPPSINPQPARPNLSTSICIATCRRQQQIQRTHAPLETTAVRYYLSKEEHQRVIRHIVSKGISARNYAVMLALKAISKDRKKGR